MLFAEINMKKRTLFSISLPMLIAFCGLQAVETGSYRPISWDAYEDKVAGG